MDVVDERLPKHGDVLVLVVELLLAVVRRRESLPREGVYEERMLLEVLLEGVLLGNDPGVVVIVDVDVVAVVLQGRVVVVVVEVVIVGVGAGIVADRHFVLAVLDVVELLVGEVVEREVSTVRGRRVDGAPLARAETEHRAHVRPCPLKLLSTGRHSTFRRRGRKKHTRKNPHKNYTLRHRRNARRRV